MHGDPRAAAVAQSPPETRLARASFQPEDARVYEDALDALDARGIVYLLGGAFAFNLHSGIWRDTKDLDVFVRPRDHEDALDALARAGFRTELVYPEWLGKAWAGPIFVDVIWRNANGLFPVDDAWITNGRATRAFRRRVLALGLEELILTKIMVAGRYRFDGGDILHLIHAASDLVDWEGLGERAGEHAELVLAYLHMYRWAYPAWRDRVPDDVLARFEERARDASREPRDPFRGRLLDIPTFQVDVEGWGLPDPHARVLASIADSERRERGAPAPPPRRPGQISASPGARRLGGGDAAEAPATATPDRGARVERATRPSRKRGLERE